jgi:DNA repair exonuclease SbcCD ATPase subunit
MLSFDDDMTPKEFLAHIKERKAKLESFKLKSKALSDKYQEEVALFKDWQQYNNNLEASKELRGKIKTYKTDYNTLIKVLKAKDIKGLREELSRLESTLKEFSNKRDISNAEYSSLYKSTIGLSESIKDGGKCPTCGTALTKAAELKKIQKKIQLQKLNCQELKDEAEVLRKEVEQCELNIEAVQSKIREYEEEKKKAESLKSSFNSSKNTLSYLKLDKPEKPEPDLASLREEVNAIGETTFRMQREVETKKNLLVNYKNLASKLKQAKESLKSIEGKYILYKWMFENLPIMKLRYIDQNKVAVENMINEALSEMGLPFVVKIDTQREMSKGKRIKDEFTFKILNIHAEKEAHPEDLSGGEEVCILLSTQFAINQVSRTNLGFEVYDEVYGPLDKKNKQIVIDSLKARGEKKQILSVSHDDEISNSFDDIVSIFQHQGVSKVKGQVFSGE